MVMVWGQEKWFVNTRGQFEKWVLSGSYLVIHSIIHPVLQYHTYSEYSLR